MRVIPVIDIKNGVVVQARAGNREKYKPVESVLTTSTDPIRVANALQKLNAKELYIADLDAIEKSGSNLGSALEIKELGFDVLFDCGVSVVEDLENLLEIGRPVIGTETLNSLEELAKITGVCEKTVLSLDFKGDRLLTRIEELKSAGIEDLIKTVSSYNIAEIIYLDLERVGMSCGMREEVIKRMVRTTSMPLLIGGGINSTSDIRRMQTLGVSGVLVATAIHRGRITKEDLLF